MTSEQACIAALWASPHRPRCPDCHGTGHNLAGVLPPVEWSPAVRRKIADGYERPLDAPDASWDERLADELSESHPGFAGLATRVVPRGEHRRAVNRIDNRGWYPKRTPIVRALSLLPRWRRGEVTTSEPT
jgi:hypothetical protein